MKIEGIKKVMVIVGRGMLDEICIDVDWPSPFPDTEDPVSLVIKAPHGRGVKYAASIGLEVNEIITRGSLVRPKFSNS